MHPVTAYPTTIYFLSFNMMSRDLQCRAGMVDPWNPGSFPSLVHGFGTHVHKMAAALWALCLHLQYLPINSLESDSFIYSQLTMCLHFWALRTYK